MMDLFSFSHSLEFNSWDHIAGNVETVEWCLVTLRVLELKNKK